MSGVENFEDAATETPRRVASRARQYLEHLRGCYPGVENSLVAEVLGYPDSSFVDTLLAGRTHYSFAKLEDFCTRSALHPPWLKHGAEKPYKPGEAGLRAGTELLKQLEDRPGTTLYLVRSDCERAGMCAVLRPNRFAWEILRSCVRVASDLGAGGRNALLNLYRLIGQARTSGFYTKTYGYTLTSEEFDSLLSGDVYPGAILENKRHCTWWDDFTDVHHKYVIADEYPRYGKQFMGAQSTLRYMLNEMAQNTRH